jgi:signal transduction histidine kinase/ActR/RegA family two-component response regulator
MLRTPPLLRLGFAAVLAVFITVALLAAAALGRTEDSSRLVLHTQQVLAQIESVLTRSVDAETGIRGFLLTGDTRFLEPFDQAEQSLRRELNELARLTDDNPRQQQRVELLRTQVAGHMALLGKLRVDYEHGRQLRPARALEQRGVMNAVRQTLREMQLGESALRDTRLSEDARAIRRTRAMGTAVLALMGALLVWVYVLLERDERRRAASDAALRQANDQLERRVAERTEAWATANAELTGVVAREQQARTELETASRLKDEFLMTISHELRTPLNPIHGWVRMLQSGAVAEPQRARALEIIERNTRAQTRLVEDLLDVSRIITGKLQLKVRRVDLQSVVQAGVESIRPAAVAKGIDLETHADAGPFIAMGDPDRLQQVVWNFLSNALKFTPPRGRVIVTLERPGDSVRISIADSGIGIVPEFLPFVFDRFRQGDTGTTRAHGGLGLGLAIARNLVELHGGSVEVDSAGLNQGTTFRVLLPSAPAAAADDAEAEWAGIEAAVRIDAGDRLDGCRVLVVDDEPESRDLLSHVLEHAGARVASASSASEAWTLLQSDTPDVLVSDIEMPGEDGYMLIRRARGLSTTQMERMIAVAVTAHARPKDRVRALQAGYQWHLPKPLEPAELVSVIASLLAAGNQDRRIPLA